MSAFAYTTALNRLLSSRSRQKLTIGDMTLVYWAEKASPAEELFADLFEPPLHESDAPQGDQDDQHTAEKIRGLLKAMRDGRRATDIIPDLDDSVRFYILGLSPNAARLSIRFWEVDSFGNLLNRIGKHFEQLSIVTQFGNEPEYPPLWRLLCQTAPLGKSENVSPILAGGMARAMLTGCRYPQNLLSLVLQRIHSEHKVTYFRAALLKAFLLRNSFDGKTEVTMSLDSERIDRPYLLGRLFAVLEKAQEEAVPGANATMKDRYLSSASATPGIVFHLLLKNSTNHIAKLRKDPEKNKRAIFFDILTQDIVSKFDEFPATLPAEDQGLFMIGYYHQRKEFFTKKTQEV
jgi:CRISPR-associated protein Csd1